MKNIYVRDCSEIIFDIILKQGRGTHHFHGDIECEMGDLFINIECKKDGTPTKRVLVEEIIDILPKNQTSIIVATIVKPIK